MIDLYTWTTPNGHKASIMLEECGLDYRVHAVDIGNRRQQRAEFLAINPNGKIPAIVDHDGIDGETRVFESGAILIYLAEKTGKFLPSSGRARAETLGWLNWQTANLGPMLGQAWHFHRQAPERESYGRERYKDEAARLFALLDNQLSKVPHVAGDAFSIADIACFSWVKTGLLFLQQATRGSLPDYPHIARWLETVGKREAVQRGILVPAD